MAYYRQIPFRVTLELMNGESHFSDEEADIYDSIISIAIVIVLAGLANAFAFRNDLVTFDRNDNPLLVTLIALS